MEVRAGDRAGLLAMLTAVFERAGVDIDWAKITTLGSSVIDVFAISTPASAVACDALERDLYAVLRRRRRRRLISRLPQASSVSCRSLVRKPTPAQTPLIHERSGVVVQPSVVRPVPALLLCRCALILWG